MNLHRFYLNDKESTKKLTPTLYALTGNKKYADAFIDSRNGKMFSHIVTSVTEEEFHQVCNKFHRCQLTRTEFKTKAMDDPTEFLSIPVVCTWDEEETVYKITDSMLTSFDVHTAMIDTSALSDDVNESLCKLGYFDVYNLMYRMEFVYKPLNPYLKDLFNEDVDIEFFKQITYDEFALFMYLYGNLMK